jgi:hypothetical protein
MWHSRVLAQGGKHHDRGHIWYSGDRLPDGHLEEFDEDFSVTLKDLSQSSYRPTDDLAHAYNLQDIDCISNLLGIPWECSKDIPFSSSIPFIGFIWDIDKKIVTLHKEKQNKYLNAIKIWQSS